MAALASWLDARAHAGIWLLRMEDLDPPRESPQAASRILSDLEALGLWWDGPVVYQSQRHEAYEAALATLTAAGHTFWCDCTRQQLAGHHGRYPGTCRQRNLPAGADRALRCRVTNDTLRFDDALQGPQASQLERETGDFIIKRRDGLHAYQLAVVVDDAWQGVTHVVRGIDLLDSTPRQLYLQHLLKLDTPHYAHIPVLVNDQGQKLSKQNLAEAVTASQPVRVLFDALQNLQQQPETGLLHADREDLLAWAVANWRPQLLSGVNSVSEIAAAANATV
jgi:glutamyl-Q tRNA(Asp) synthetase